jgi:nucleoside-diphosphate-sugar epimerase
MKTLVTGGGGFIGRHIVEQLLARGDEVTVFARDHYPELAALGARLVRGDLVDGPALSRACAGMEIVFHVAAQASLWGAWPSFYQPNVIGSQNVIAACRSQGVAKLVFTSSPSVVFSRYPHRGVDESQPYPDRFQSYYSHTKALAEQAVIQANGPELLTTALRPHVVWGPRDSQILPRLIDRAKSGKLIQVGDGRNKIDMTYIDDAARAHLLAADALSPGSAVAGSVYFISQDDPVQPWAFINQILERLDIPPIKRRIPLGLARALGGLIEAPYRLFSLPGEPRLTRYLASQMALDHYYDISRAKRDFGYQPQVTMAEGLERTVAYFKEHL